MGDGTIFTLGMVGFNLLLGPAVLLVVGLVLRAAWRRRAGAASGGSRAAARLGCAVLVLLPICAFAGVMVASVGGALHLPVVTFVAPAVCDGTVASESHAYSYRVGIHGTANTVYCTAADGTRRDITLRTIAMATLFYTAIFLAAALVLIALVRLMRPRRVADGPGGVEAQMMAAVREALTRRLRSSAVVTHSLVASRAGTVEDRLRHLEALREGGLVSEAEYRAKRRDILAGL